MTHKTAFILERECFINSSSREPSGNQRQGVAVPVKDFV
jgi:hypothetical protein